MITYIKGEETMNKFIFGDISVERKGILEEDVELKTKKLADGGLKFLSGKGQIADEIYEISSGHIMFDAKCQRKDYLSLKAEVINLIKANLIIYGDRFITDIRFAEKQIVKGLKAKFSCKSCTFISLEASKSVEGEFEVSSVKGKQLLQLVSINKEQYNYDINNQLNQV